MTIKPFTDTPFLELGKIPLAGGTTEYYGYANNMDFVDDTATQNITTDRQYLMAFYVDQQSTLTESMVTISTASSTGGSLMRTGIYTLGVVNGVSWSAGTLIEDFGTQPFDATGNYSFTPAGGQLVLNPGWYANAFVANGASGTVRYVRTRSAGRGAMSLYPHNATTYRNSGFGISVYENNQGAAVTGGLTADMSTFGTQTDTTSANFSRRDLVINKWLI